MRHLGKACIAASLAVLVTAACFDDPTSDLRNGGSRLSVNKTFVVINVNQVDQIDIRVLDDQGNPQEFGEPTFASVDPSVATLTPLADSALRRNPGNTIYKSTLSGLAAGQTAIAITAGGVTDTILVQVYPVAFTGTIAPATVNAGDTITITAPASITFDPAASVTIGGAPPYATVDVTSSAMRVIAGPTGANQTIDVTGSILLGTIGLPTLTSTGTITINEPGEGANNAAGTAPAVAIPAAVGSTTSRFGSLDGSDVDDWFTITTTTADSIEVIADWATSAIDVDIILWNAAGTGLVNASGATGAHPEVFRIRLAAATTYKLQVNLYDDHGFPTPVAYRLRVIKRG